MAQRTRTERHPNLQPTPETTPVPASVPRPYRRRPLLLLVAALLFFGWIGWLAFLVLTARPPVVVSHPQVLAATVDVIARVEGLDQPVHVNEILWPADCPKRDELLDRDVTVVNLEYCTPNWSGPGSYLLPLRQADDGKWIVAPTPPQPGYPPPEGGERKRVGPPRIYPDTPSVRAQHAQLRR